MLYYYLHLLLSSQAITILFTDRNLNTTSFDTSGSGESYTIIYFYFLVIQKFVFSVLYICMPDYARVWHNLSHYCSESGKRKLFRLSEQFTLLYQWDYWDLLNKLIIC